MFRAILIAAAAAAALSTATAQAGESCSTKNKNNGHVQYKPRYVQQVYVKPIHVTPVKYCYYVLYYKLPCWDYQKELKFDNLHEAKQMAQLLYDNGYRLALTKFESHSYDKVGYDQHGGGKMQGEILFQGQGKITNSKGQSQLIDGPVLLGGAD